MTRKRTPKRKATEPEQEPPFYAPVPVPKPVARRLSSAERVAEFGVDALCDRLIEGRSLRAVAAEIGVPPSAILRWIDGDPELARRYAAARAEQAETLASELIELADEIVPRDNFGRVDSGAVADKRLRIDARKWVAAKLKPQTYGDRLDLNAKLDVEPNEAAIDRRLMYLMSKVTVLPPGSNGGSVPPVAG